MATTGVPITTVTADAGYAYAKVYGGLERRGIDAVIPAKAEPIRSPVPLRRFRYDARHDIVKCPRGKILRPGNPVAHGRFFYARKRDCDRCALASSSALCPSAALSIVPGRLRVGGWAWACSGSASDMLKVQSNVGNVRLAQPSAECPGRVARDGRSQPSRSQ